MKETLPVDSFIASIQAALGKHNNLVITAAPGAGKTTRVPPALLSITDKKILVLEPRRLAAVAASQRIAEENNWNWGQEVGYQVRFENQISPETRLIFLTEALLTRKMLKDPELKDIGIVILDEFHERSLHVDLAIGLLRELQQMSRPDLKIIVMSATLDAQMLSKFLDGCPIVNVPGKLYDMNFENIKEAQLLKTDRTFIERVTEQVKKFASKERHTLVFLPGRGEIERCKEALSEWAQSQQRQLLSLHGQLSLKEQREVLQPSSIKKVILTTNIAESSLTVDQVDTVIDSGLARIQTLHPRTGFEQLSLSRISKASATQRAGRSARQYPGRVLQMWSSLDVRSMPDFESAEIQRSDLTETLLLLSQLGVRDFQNFSWIESPTALQIQRALRQLQNWDLLDSDNKITSLGEKVSRLPLHPRLGRLLLAAQDLGAGLLGCEVVALLQDKDILRGTPNHDSRENDLIPRLELYRKNTQAFPNIKKATEQLRQLLTTIGSSSDLNLIPQFLLHAYKDRLCHRRRPGENFGIMLEGRGVKLSDNSCVKKAEFFFALDLMDGITAADTSVSLACAIDRTWIEREFKNEIQSKTEIIFDEQAQKLTRQECRYLQQMPLENPRPLPLTTEQIQQFLPQIVLSRWETVKNKNEDLKNWLIRYNYYVQQKNLPALSPPLLQLVIEQACYNEKSFEAVAAKDFVSLLEMNSEEKTIKDFHRECPARLQVPSGKIFQLQYFEDKNPLLEVRLQEVFGWKNTPTVLNGKIPVTLSLLGPNYRPVQVTQDLESFWKKGYIEVRKELRARYPKHKWPEDPTLFYKDED